MIGVGENMSGGIARNNVAVIMKYPANITISDRDRVTDIRNKIGQLLWREEEFDDAGTVFNVKDVSPILDPFGNYIENSALLQRAEVQSG